MDIVVDTNVLVAGLRSRNGASNALLHKIRDRKEFVLHLSTAAVLEYEEVLVRELVPAYLPSRDILWFLDDLIAASVCHASIRRFRSISNDPDDDCMIELALTADVQVLVTHNKAHFRELPERGIEVLTPAEILRFLNL
ncbi:MAG: putative toxin-antitoxin system toxin component, PIN family [Spartobacteria bacterium]